jgi:hypothetical protein
MAAAEKGHVEIVKTLREFGVDVARSYTTGVRARTSARRPAR